MSSPDPPHFGRRDFATHHSLLAAAVERDQRALHGTQASQKKRRTDNKHRCGVRDRDFNAVTSAAAAKRNRKGTKQKERGSRRLRDSDDDELTTNFSTGESG